MLFYEGGSDSFKIVNPENLFMILFSTSGVFLICFWFLFFAVLGLKAVTFNNQGLCNHSAFAPDPLFLIEKRILYTQGREFNRLSTHFACGTLGLEPQKAWSPKYLWQWLLNTKSGVAPEYCWICPPNPNPTQIPLQFYIIVGP